MAQQEAKSGERSWYAVHTYSGYEDAVVRYLTQRIESFDMQNKIFNVLVPKERKVKIKNGKRKVTEEKIYPGYVLVDMIMDEGTWYVVRNTPRVTGFVGADSTEPTPLSNEEIHMFMEKMGVEEPKFNLDVEVGDMVKISDGPFKDYEGKVSEIDEERGKIKVLVSMFGRETPIELDFLQIKKV
ncbi:MAG: transcription termination/antitermination protein NusG [Patescibacteria group bacterium]|nr:transcription termination/antitermination protein NusG [Patescibacteria group bacterium]MDE2438072.1 transcription termination/antitermination protein NusG [Patescibacteria group bacterium]